MCSTNFILNMKHTLIDYKELAHSWSIVNFLIEKHPIQFKSFVKKIISGKNGKKTQVPLLKEVFNWTLKDFETQWYKYIKKE